MSDPLRTDSTRAHGAAADALERDAKIEQLLLLGLDHYFSAQYEQAVNVWTRALFLDRTHARARAYIERARSALAERQRQSEELLQHGLEALNRGDTLEARRSLQVALERGAVPEDVAPLVDRLSRLDAGAAAPAVRRPASERPAAAAPGSARRRARSAFLRSSLYLGLLAAIVYGAYAAVSLGGPAWSRWLSFPNVALPGPSTPSAAGAPVVRDVVLTPPTRAELALGLARSLFVTGHLHDALTALDRVRLTDPQRPDADRLRSEIQRHLLRLEQR
jgi:cytochrome c-type biogenesis protein CcmH/NrfG